MSSLSLNMIASLKYTILLTSAFVDHHRVYIPWTTFREGILRTAQHSASRGHPGIIGVASHQCAGESHALLDLRHIKDDTSGAFECTQRD